MNHFIQSSAQVKIPAILLLSLSLAVLFPVAVSAADDDAKGWFIPKDTVAKNFYVGARAGLNDNDFPDSNQDGSVTGVSTDGSGTTTGLFIGYQINDHLAVEGGYRDFGKSDFNGVSSGGPSWSAGPVSALHEADGWELGVMGRWPLTDRWYALGYVGWNWWESKETFIEGTVVTTENNSGGDVAYALGLEYDIGLKDRIVYRFMGAYHAVDDSGYNINSATAEIVYRFP